MFDKKEEEKGLYITTAIVFSLLPVIALLKAFVLTKLWLWFMVPFGLPVIGLAHAYGLTILIFLFTYTGLQTNQNKKEDEDVFTILGRFLFIGFGIPLVSLGIGFLCHYWM